MRFYIWFICAVEYIVRYVVMRNEEDVNLTCFFSDSVQRVYRTNNTHSRFVFTRSCYSIELSGLLRSERDQHRPQTQCEVAQQRPLRNAEGEESPAFYRAFAGTMH